MKRSLISIGAAWFLLSDYDRVAVRDSVTDCILGQIPSPLVNSERRLCGSTHKIQPFH